MCELRIFTLFQLDNVERLYRHITGMLLQDCKYCAIYIYCMYARIYYCAILIFCFYLLLDLANIEIILIFKFNIEIKNK